MTDFLYVVGSAAFFAVMLVYVKACQRLGRPHSAAEREQ